MKSILKRARTAVGAVAFVAGVATFGQGATAATCTPSGTGNMTAAFTLVSSGAACVTTGNNSFSNAQGYTSIDSDGVSSFSDGGALNILASGGFTIDSALVSAYSSLFVVLSAATATNPRPDWALFSLGSGVYSASSFSTTGDALLSVGLYGIVRSTAVPGPIAGAGIPALLAFGGVLWARRRKMTAV